MKRIRALAVAAVIAGGATLGVAGPASASSFNGLCETGEVCLFWGSNYYGSLADFSNNILNYKSFYFKSSGSGQGQTLNDNSESAKNHGRVEGVQLFVDSYYRGDWIAMAPGDQFPDFGPYDNKFSSHKWYLIG